MDVPGIDPPPKAPSRLTRVKTQAEAAKKAGTEILEREQANRASVRIAVNALDRDRGFAGGLLAGGLAFRVFLWLLPLTLVVVTAFASAAEGLNQAPSDLARQSGLSSAIAATIAKGVEASNNGRWYLLVVGVFLTLWAGMGVVKAARLISGLAWEVPPKMGQNPLASSVRLGLGVIALAAIKFAVASALSGPFVSDVLVIALETALLTLLCIWIFAHLPHAPGVGLREMWPGALLVALGALGTRVATIVYFSGKLDRVDDLYGALGVAAVFMAWLFILARLWVVGTGLNASTHLNRADGTSHQAD
jgi:uncharacterized BrkB/YihY/UPF0761 family membrane protein